MRKTMTVNLSARTTLVTDTPHAAINRFLGGRGYAASLLFDLVPPEAASEISDNALILSSGILNGTPWPAASRYHLTFRSPLTGCYGYANAGGKFGPYLAHAGLDALVITGRASAPSIVIVDGNRALIESAVDLWGETSGRTEDALHERYPESSVACIGPAGENGVLYASVMNDGGRAAGRTGGGAVFGSKNLKAVVILATQPTSFSQEFLAEAKTATKKVLAAPATPNLSKWGTPFLTAIKNTVGDLPTKNHQLGQVPFIDKIDAEAFEHYKIQTKGCLGCPIRCGRISEVKEGAYQCRTAGPEYETIDSFGPQCYCQDAEAIIYANMLCNELGLDTLSTGASIAFAMECHENGLLDSDGLDLSWGNSETIIALIELIAAREGLGELLADGVKRAARTIGNSADRYAMEVKGLEIPSQEGRVAKGFALGHATSNRGADHLYGLPTIDTAHLEEAGAAMLPHVMPDVMDPLNEETKPDLLVVSEHYCAVADSLGVCKFSTVETYPLYPKDLAKGLSALGIETSASDLLKAGERIINLERMYNVRLGMTAADDRLPSRFTEEALLVQHGGNVTQHIVEDMDAMLAKYYSLRGWNEMGIPTADKLRELGLDFLIGDYE
ncbi:aldehyde ferredoxin oxidoreductase family protein [Candidatus Bipolaricaulota bacterium]